MKAPGGQRVVYIDTKAVKASTIDGNRNINERGRWSISSLFNVRYQSPGIMGNVGWAIQPTGPFY